MNKHLNQVLVSTKELISLFSVAGPVDIAAYLHTAETLSMTGSLTDRFFNALEDVLNAGLGEEKLPVLRRIQLSEALRNATLECLHRQITFCEQRERLQALVAHGAARARMNQQIRESKQ